MTHRVRRPPWHVGGLVRIRPQRLPQRILLSLQASNGLSTPCTPPTTTPSYLKKVTAEAAL